MGKGGVGSWPCLVHGAWTGTGTRACNVSGVRRGTVRNLRDDEEIHSVCEKQSE